MLRLISCDDGTYKRGVFINVWGKCIVAITFWHTVERDDPLVRQAGEASSTVSHVIGFRGGEE